MTAGGCGDLEGCDVPRRSLSISTECILHQKTSHRDKGFDGRKNKLIPASGYENLQKRDLLTKINTKNYAKVRCPRYEN
ncbi:hypothetical protein NDU88_011095 [Pleurodeles waltl]|uniref:Uncharacterized protein n=1 Tax=Pleurodeles waltl TaxID=8319 RepID=A0AAV7R2E4_PLEWA|nr:hypothetical protein NDU88_011095 [Pleurodeles waltl]